MIRYLVIVLLLAGIVVADPTLQVIQTHHDGDLTLYFDTEDVSRSTFTFLGGSPAEYDREPDSILGTHETETAVHFKSIDAKQAHIKHGTTEEYIDLRETQCLWAQYDSTTPACEVLLEQSDGLYVAHVVRYDDPGSLYIQLHNKGEVDLALSTYTLRVDWGETQALTDDIDDMIGAGKYRTVILHKDTHKESCDQPFFVGLFKDDQLISSNRGHPLLCFSKRPQCGDQLCSQFEDVGMFGSCADDCAQPINLAVQSLTFEGIAFDFTYAREVCMYTVHGPEQKQYTELIEPEKESEDGIVRYESYHTASMEEMFGTFKNGKYRLVVSCTPPDVRQQYEEKGCHGCMIKDVCVRADTWVDALYCDETGEIKRILEVGEACEEHMLCRTNYCRKGMCKQKTISDRLYEALFWWLSD